MKQKHTLPAAARATAALELFKIASLAQRDAMALTRIGRALLNEEKATKGMASLRRYADCKENGIYDGFRFAPDQAGEVLADLEAADDPAAVARRHKHLERMRAANKKARGYHEARRVLYEAGEIQDRYGPIVPAGEPIEQAAVVPTRNHGILRPGGNVVSGPWPDAG